ncbi:uncharacterized protein RHOBADRAFT_54888 [Rhodotorula graminis WP1]|uniref:Uncharacterized protein n=1 Tax=Rhodotorula graminis (strain WP1) TaxID=578459 RepID=A0A0P9FD73_RHOGW|nr:uncharacterized protein RHOBADRAFT_54888 [Rhodotorula graminis WP1]KPV73694.1 hypothetical protein RHOBADRAFT_54888 [Rhodotorula graminis WP1]
MDAPEPPASSTTAPQHLIAHGTWSPAAQIAYGIASATFSPSTASHDPDSGTQVELNPHLVPLEVGDEVYVVEVFRPSRSVASSSASTTEDGVWYRGYVVSTAPNPRLPSPTDAAAFHSSASSGLAPALAQEPQVALGIFPASHVQIREHLADDAERTFSHLADLEERGSPAAGGSDDLFRSTSRAGGSGRAARMEILQEEDEPDEDGVVNGDRLSRRQSRLVQLAPASSSTKARNRSSVGSAATFGQQFATEQRVAFRSSRLSFTGDLDAARPPPPLPNLKCGDETISGTDEPLVDEIACALREWASALYSHLYRRNYVLFDTVREHITVLHAARKQLLSGALSADERRSPRRDAVARLVQGNVEQGLDVIVRDPRSGGLVDVNVEGEVDHESSLSVVKMYAAQVALAYGAPMPSTGLAREPAPPSSSSSSYHVVLDVRHLAAQVAAPGEHVELAFSLYAKGESRFVTEEYCLVLNAAGAPARDGPMRTVFRDLGQHDVSDQLFLVCRIVKNGALKGSSGGGPSPASPSPQADSSSSFFQPSASRSDAASIDTSSSRPARGGKGPRSMLVTDSSGRQSCRRPFGCAVLEISHLDPRLVDDVSSDSPSILADKQMPVFVPTVETSFSTLHEDIIASRVKEFEKHARAEHLSVGVSILQGSAAALARRLPVLVAGAPTTGRLDFADVALPGDQRNDVYVALSSGDFRQGAASSGAGANGGGTSTVWSLAQLAAGSAAGTFEVAIEYTSTVLRANNCPTWAENVKLAIAPERIVDCHLFLTVRNRARASSDPPFAFAYLPLFPASSSAFLSDGIHTLVLYRYDHQVASPSFYLQVPAVHDSSRQGPSVPPAVAKTLIPLRDTVTLRTHLVSTAHTQNETILRLLRWQQDLVHDPDLMRDTLAKLTFTSELEVGKFLRTILDSLFGILVSTANSSGELDDLVFQALVVIFGFVSDKRLTNFRPVLDQYISQSFTSSAASSHIVGQLQRLLRSPASPETATSLRSTIKVFKWLLRLVVRSREIQRAKEPGFGTTASTLEAGFKSDISAVLKQLNALMRTTSPSSIIGTQTVVLQHFPTILPELAAVFAEDELLEVVIAFVDSVGAVKGKMAVWKILCLRELAHSTLFVSPSGRAALVPSMIRWLKPFLAKFDAMAACSPKDPQATRDAARVGWVEGIRLATGVVAAMLDVVHEALVEPSLARDLLAQEHDNVEYLLALVPRLLEAYRELENLAYLDAIERQRSQASIPAVVPLAFPSSYPVALLSYPPNRSRKLAAGGRAPTQKDGDDEPAWPTLRSGLGDIACVFLAMVQLAPRAILVNWLEATVEVEGRDTFARQLGSIFRVARGILENEAFPAEWLNTTALAHRVVLKLVEPAAEVLAREFVPPPTASFQFNTSLWRDFFGVLLELLSSTQLLIEEFSPQKRRAVWRLAGDVRGEGALVLSHAWSVISRSSERQQQQKGAGFQVQFVPALVEKVLALCLSHHDELRRVAVNILYSMIVAEFELSRHFALIEAECIDKLDKLFGQQTKGDEVSRSFFVTQLRQLFVDADLDDELRAQAASFLDSIDSFLDLLLAVRGLPEGDEYQDDRIISTLKLMSFIRTIGRSEIFVRYVQRLVGHHNACGNYVEAALTLKLHADLHEWNLSNLVDPLPDLDLPRQTEFARKETLYLRILEHLGKGQAYETAIDLVRELELEYERTFNYPRLAELLHLKAELYARIAQADRQFGAFFRVAFFGTRWPSSISGKQFIYRGEPAETLGSFVERMMNKHSSATLLQTSEIPSDDVQHGDSQFLQITAVTAEVDQTAPVFMGPDVPAYVQAYYLHNETNTFSFTRPLRKDPVGHPVGSTSEPAASWSEKTVLIVEDSFPTVLRRSEVIEIRLIEISPVENAVRAVYAQQKELATLERRYRALAQSENEGGFDSTQLSRALNSACDTPVDKGVSMYRRVFLEPGYVAHLPPSQVAIVRQLETAIDELVVTLVRCLKLHALVVSPDMRAFHDTLERFFEKNFAAELARLPDHAFYEPASSGRVHASSTGSSSARSTTRSEGSVPAVSSSPSAIPPGSISAVKRESVSAQAANDESLETRMNSATPYPRAASISSSTARDGRASPTRSLVSVRSGSLNGDGAAPVRRPSLLHTAVKKLGRRKGSEVAAVAEE